MFSFPSYIKYMYNPVYSLFYRVIFIYSPMLISPPLKIKAYIVVKTWRGANRQHVLRVRQRHLTLLWLSTAPMEVLEQVMFSAVK